MLTRTFIAPALFMGLMLALLAAPAARAELSGAYVGMDDAAGMKLEFSGSGSRLSVRLTGRGGATREFSATRLETGAEAQVKVDGRNLVHIFTEEPLGVTLVTFPVNKDELPVAAETEALLFLRAGVKQPPKPSHYVEAPQGPGGRGARVDPRAFVESYAFWPSQNAAWGYEMVRDRYRSLIRMFPLVQADILWKLCRGGATRAALAEALRGQDISCQTVLDTFGRMLGSVNTFNKYRTDVEAQKVELIAAIGCSLDYRRNSPECKRVGSRVAQAAISMETVRTALARY